MDFDQAIKNRDALIRASISTAISHAKTLDDNQKNEIATIAIKAFSDGIKDWEDKYLELAVGPEEAGRIRGIFGNEHQS